MKGFLKWLESPMEDDGKPVPLIFILLQPLLFAAACFTALGLVQTEAVWLTPLFR